MADILVLGATGFTGRLITEYLYHHPERSSFTFALGARSQSKLAQLRRELGVDDSIKTLQVDVTNESQLEEVVKQVKVVLNVVGPYYRWSTPVVRACARNGVHYVDLSGETHWVRDIIEVFDYIASKTHAIIVPACGFDSIPSDIAVYLSNKTLKAVVGPDTAIDHSISAFRVRGGVSGGTLSSVVSGIEDISLRKRNAARRDFITSPFIGVQQPKPRPFYTLPYSSPPIYGGLFAMSSTNRAVVQRTWGLHEFYNRWHRELPETERKPLRYGPELKYEEFMVTPSKTTGVLLSVGLVVTMMSLLFAPARWLFKKFALKPGEGPSPETLKNGFMEITNVTTSVATPTQPAQHVRTIIKGKGDPGYALTAVMISESALSILLHPDELPPLAHEGGVLTPMSALGDVLIRRLEKTGRISFESEVIVGGEVEGKKTR